MSWSAEATKRLAQELGVELDIREHGHVRELGDEKFVRWSKMYQRLYSRVRRKKIKEAQRMGVVEGFCFSCHDTTVFQMTGQTKDYDPNRVAGEYIKEYEAAGLPVMKCPLCDFVFRYRKELDGKWHQVEVKL